MLSMRHFEMKERRKRRRISRTHSFINIDTHRPDHWCVFMMQFYISLIIPVDSVLNKGGLCEYEYDVVMSLSPRHEIRHHLALSETVCSGQSSL